MARSTAEIQASITASYVSEMASVGITVDPSTWSRVDLERQLMFVAAADANYLEELYDLLRIEIDTRLKEQKPHTPRWYAGIAKLYQHGYNLIAEGDTYDNTGVSAADIAAAKIVKYSAVVEQVNVYGRVSLRIKLATNDGTDLTPLSPVQLAGVKEYFARVKDGGVHLQIDSLPPDNIKQSWIVYYDPLILDAAGSRLDGTDSSPVRTAIKSYLENLPFNGTYVLAYHIDAVQAIDGVVIPTITEAVVKYGLLDYQSVNVLYNPDAGYLRFYNENDLSITYIAQSAIQ